MYREAMKEQTHDRGNQYTGGKRNNITEAKKLTTGTSRAYTLARLKREWLPWCRENLRFHFRSARRYMEIYAKRDTLSHLKDLTEAYRLLSQPAGEVASKLKT
jgi:hypothetical protein